MHATGVHSDEAIAVAFAAEGVTVQRLQTQRRQDRKREPSAWPIDTAKERALATQAMLANQAVIEAGGKADAVMAAARQVAGVLTRHRWSAGRAHEVCVGLLEELETTTSRKGDLERILHAVEDGLEGEALSAIRSQFRNFMNLHARAGSMAKLADALGKAHVSERKAYGVPDSPAESSPVDALSDEQLQAELQRLGDELAAMRADPGQAKALPALVPRLVA